MKDLFGDDINDWEDIKYNDWAYPMNGFDVFDLNNYKNQANSKLLKIALGSSSYKTREHIQTINNVNNSKFLKRPVSIFNPLTCDMIYKFYLRGQNEKILDIFAGSEVRGGIAALNKKYYTGLELRQEQIDHNESILLSLGLDKYCEYMQGDSLKLLDTIQNNYYDMMFTCPPYYLLEKYCDNEADGGGITEYNDYILWLQTICKKAINKVKPDGWYIIVIENSRDKKGQLMPVCEDLTRCLIDSGLFYHQKIICIMPYGSAPFRMGANANTYKLVKTHQTILVFRKKEAK